MTMLRYGVFRLAQIWTLVGDDGFRIGFPTRKSALDAAEDMIDLQRALGGDVELLIQDDLGFVRPVELPVSRNDIASREFVGRDSPQHSARDPLRL